VVLDPPAIIDEELLVVMEDGETVEAATKVVEVEVNTPVVTRTGNLELELELVKINIAELELVMVGIDIDAEELELVDIVIDMEVLETLV
jgi:hypothetical protein